MKLLVLHGHNMNLYGIRSSHEGKKITLDKINRYIRNYIRDKNVDIKKHANLINKVDSKLAEINSLTKEVYPNKNLDDVLEKVLDKIESNNNQ